MKKILVLLVVLAGLWQVRGMLGWVSYQEDIQYGSNDGVPLYLDLAQPRFHLAIDSATSYPAILVFHGGGWLEGSKKDMAFMTKLLAQQGYVAATVQYRLSNQAKFPAAIHDVKCAVRWLRKNASELNVNPQRIAVLGGSAGAHLALMLGLTQPTDNLEGGDCHAGYSTSVNAVVNLVGPTDLSLSGLDHFTAEFLGPPVNSQAERARLASPLTYVSADDPPVLTVHGTADQVVDYQHALLLKQALEKAGVAHTLVAAEGAGHGWLGIQNALNAHLAMNAFLNTHLRN